MTIKPRPERKPRRLPATKRDPATRLAAYDRKTPAQRKADQRQRAQDAAVKAGFASITDLVNAILTDQAEVVHKNYVIS